MLRRRLLYGAALLAAGLFFLFFSGYFALFLLITLLALPLISLALSLPGALGSTLSLSLQPERAVRGEEGRLLLSLTFRSPFPLSRFSAALLLEHSFSGLTRRQALRLCPPAGGCALEQEMDTSRCGRWTVRCVKPRVCDLLGLFSLPVKAPPEGTLFVLPVPMEAGPAPALTGARGRDLGLKPRPGGGPGEDYELRPYRPGDSMRAVHWKLSSKLDDLVVRETMEPRRAALLLTFDHFGPPEEVDGVLDRLCALSRRLLEGNLPHFIQWVHPVTGQLEHWDITDEGSLSPCLLHILSQPAPLTGKSILDVPLSIPGGDGPPRRLHITCALWREGGTA